MISFEDKDYIASSLLEFFKAEPKKAIHWLLTENPQFGNTSPAWLICMDRQSKVVKFIENAIFENSPPDLQLDLFEDKK